jgi:hypothetical protein
MNGYLKFLWTVFKGVSIGIGWFTMFNVIIGLVGSTVILNSHKSVTGPDGCFMMSGIGDKSRPIYRVCRLK